MSMESYNIAGTILQQLGGPRFAMMTGSKKFTANPAGVFFYVGRNSKGVNYCRIELVSDLYNIEYGFIRSGRVTVKSTSEGVYADQLQADFTRNTGLDTHL
jgi:hypothetical protein